MGLDEYQRLGLVSEMQYSILLNIKEFLGISFGIIDSRL